MHGTSHHMGLDTHDYGLLWEPMKTNMVFTVEPGIYIPEEGFGIRLEDDLVIQEKGAPLNLMKHIPIAIEEIEDIMREGEEWANQCHILESTIKKFVENMNDKNDDIQDLKNMIQEKDDKITELLENLNEKNEDERNESKKRSSAISMGIIGAIIGIIFVSFTYPYSNIVGIILGGVTGGMIGVYIGERAA